MNDKTAVGNYDYYIRENEWTEREVRTNEEFETWYKNFNGDGFSWEGNTENDMKAAYFAGAAAGYTNGVTTMREKAAEVADNKDMFSGDMLDRLAEEIAGDIRKIEVE